MSPELSGIREGIIRSRRSGRGPRARFPEGLVRAAVAYARSRLDAGFDEPAICRELDLARVTLSRWLGRARCARPGLRRVELSEAVTAHAVEGRGAGLTLETPNGIRIEGLGPVEAARIALWLERELR